MLCQISFTSVYKILERMVPIALANNTWITLPSNNQRKEWQAKLKRHSTRVITVEMKLC